MLRRPQRYAEGRLRISTSRSGSGPPLLLIHGLSGSRRWWRRNLRALERHFTVYRIELAGFGYARRQPPMPLAQSAALIVRWMDSVHIERAHVLGHSMGGHTAVHLAGSFPQRVDALVLVAPTGLLRGQWWRLATRLPRAALSGRLDFIPIVATDALRAGIVTIWRAGRALLRDDVQDLLSRITAPTLVVSGGRDVLVPPSLGGTLARVIGARHVCLPDAGHVVMWDSPEEFNEEVIDFLRVFRRRGAA